jgi:hypothetical protein
VWAIINNNVITPGFYILFSVVDLALQILIFLIIYFSFGCSLFNMKNVSDYFSLSGNEVAQYFILAINVFLLAGLAVTLLVLTIINKPRNFYLEHKMVF